MISLTFNQRKYQVSYGGKLASATSQMLAKYQSRTQAQNNDLIMSGW